LRKIFSVHQKFFTFPISNMWQVYTRPTSASDFLANGFRRVTQNRFFTRKKCVLYVEFPDLSKNVGKKKLGIFEKLPI
jgi:hypothetical protein